MSKGKVTDYRSYCCSKKEKVIYGAEGMVLFCGLGYLFFREWLISAVVSSGAVFYIKKREREKKQTRREQLGKEFCQGAEAILNALEVGYSKENAVREAIKDMKENGKKDSLMLTELVYMQRQLAVNRPLEELFLELGERSGIADIKTFGEVFAAAGKRGGNLVQIIKKDITVMKEKQAVLQEIQVQTASRRLEFHIMCLIVPGMILYLQLFSPGFLDILYHNLLGQLFMTLVMAVYLGAICLGERMTEIEI
ncbi:MAG: type II secretion system F family protein [Acetivibrio ethanolgignens]